MKNLLMFILLFCSMLGMAQMPNPVKWTFQAIPMSTEGKYTIVAHADIESGWHVFSNNPGGDGLLIPTEMSVDSNDKSIKVDGPMQIDGKLITKEMDGVGVVNYYEHKASFKLTIVGKSEQIIKGVISYQLCNEQMCLPPTDVPFSIKL